MEDKRRGDGDIDNEIFPNNEQVRLIFKDTYNFYTKWIAVKEPDWSEVMEEVYKLEAAYPFNLCRKILVEIVAIIEAKVMERSKQDG